ncbi:MAG: hypothetical protein KDI31_15995, partial [Pseudomonadales bacterium]|nr:hypothetical protein [Pseudomonadales bacterium]
SVNETQGPQHLLRGWRVEVIDWQVEGIQPRSFEFMCEDGCFRQREYGLDAEATQDSQIAGN